MKLQRLDDPVLRQFNAAELRITAEFLTNCLPFLSKGLCNRCIRTLSDRIRSLDHISNDYDEQSNQEENVSVATTNNKDATEYSGSQGNYDTNSLGSWNMNDMEDTNSLGSWKDGGNGWSEQAAEVSTSEAAVLPVAPVKSPRVRKSWADMALEEELAEQENEGSRELDDEDSSRPLDDDTVLLDETIEDVKVSPKAELSRDQREHIRFTNVKRKKDYICLERVNGRLVNILDGLELHSGVFSAAEQKRIVDFVYELQEMGEKGQLKERTFTAPQKWMRGKGRVTIQFGCCYNYATDRSGNPPGILRKERVDPIPHLFKVIIRRLIRWHVLPHTCVPDSCIVNIYDEGDCIPPHIDNHDFLRPFCTVSFLSECNIVFGLNLKVDGPGEFSGAMAIPLPVGSVLVFNGKGADVAKHCVPAVSTRRISITFRKMAESKWPIGFAPEPDLQGLQPLSYETDESTNGSAKASNSLRLRRPSHRLARREDVREISRGILGPEPRLLARRRGPRSASNWRRPRVSREF